MALSVSNQSAPVGAKLLVDTQAVAQSNVTAAVGKIWTLDLDNSANGAATWIKLADALAAVPGTTVPDLQIKLKAGQRRQVVFPEGWDFDTGLSYWCVTAREVAATTAPAQPVVVRAVLS